MADEAGYQSYSQENPPGSVGTLVQAAKDTPLLGTGIQAYQDATKGDIGALAGDIGNFVLGASAVVEDPLNALISAGLNWLADVISPIRDCLEKVTGNADALDKAKESFEDIGKDIENLASELDQITKTGFANWTGDAKEAASQKVDTFVQGVEGTASNADDVSQVLSMSGMLMEGAYNIIMGILSACVEWLIVTWIAALAAEIPTCGASTAAAGAATTAEVGVEGAEAADKVEEATSLVERIVQIFEKIIGKLKSLEGDAESAAGDVESTAESAAEGTAENTAESTAENTAESTAENTAEGTAENTAEGTAESTTESSAESTGESTASGEGGSGDGGSGSGEGGEGSGEGSSSDSNSENKNFFQKKWDEVQENWNKSVNPTAEQAGEAKSRSLGTYLTEHETKEDGTQGLNKIQDILLDPVKEDTIKMAGQLLDGDDSSGQSDQQVDSELQG